LKIPTLFNKDNIEKEEFIKVANNITHLSCTYFKIRSKHQMLVIIGFLVIRDRSTKQFIKVQEQILHQLI